MLFSTSVFSCVCSSKPIFQAVGEAKSSMVTSVFDAEELRTELNSTNFQCMKRVICMRAMYQKKKLPGFTHTFDNSVTHNADEDPTGHALFSKLLKDVKLDHNLSVRTRDANPLVSFFFVLLLRHSLHCTLNVFFTYF